MPKLIVARIRPEIPKWTASIVLSDDPALTEGSSVTIETLWSYANKGFHIVILPATHHELQTTGHHAQTPTQHV